MISQQAANRNMSIPIYLLRALSLYFSFSALDNVLYPAMSHAPLPRKNTIANTTKSSMIAQ